MTRSGPIGEDDLQAAVDGRLEPGRRELVECYLDEQPAVGGRVAEMRRQRTALRERLAAKALEPIPPRLRIAAIRDELQRRHRSGLTRGAIAACWIALGIGLGWLGHSWLGDPWVGAPRSDALTREAIAAHRTFVVEVRHPVEVDVGQEAHLVQWLSRRLSHKLKAPDLSADGYRLMGGRLLPASEGAAAQLMYENAGGQRLTVYLRADAAGETRFRYVEAGGIGAFYWIDDGFGYAVSGAPDRRALLRIAEAVYHQTAEAPEQGQRAQTPQLR